MLANQGLRTPALGYSADIVRQKFTQKERDIETGLDYFRARYYSSTQGRFTSPDEFTGGPDELYYFVDDASANPTFYADLRKPQSLNKYQYAYNNPLRWVDPDGHCPDDKCPEVTTTRPAVTGDGGPIARDMGIGIYKVAANLLIGVKNIGAMATGGQLTEPYDSASDVQDITMHVLEVGTLVSPLLNQAGPATVMTASSRQAVVATEEAVGQTRVSTLKPGPFAEGSIPARGPQRNFTTAEKAANKANFESSGCHTCGTKIPSTKNGAVLDHQPPTGINVNSAAQRLYPQCLGCSRKQGGDVNSWKRGLPGSP